MAIAELHGKAPALESLEDALTSHVFGTLRCIPPEVGLVPFLKTCCSFERPHISFPEINGITRVSYFFWPRGIGVGCEPDLVIVLQTLEKPVVICVEAKFQSGKSNRDDPEDLSDNGDQLAIQWRELVSGAILPRRILADEDRGEEVLEALTKGVERYLIYVTAHYAPPTAHLQETLSCLASGDLRDTYSYRLFWTSWYKVLPVLDGLVSDPQASWQTRMLAGDLAGILRRRGLVPFSGIGAHKPTCLTLTTPLYFSGPMMEPAEITAASRCFFSQMSLPPDSSIPLFFRPGL